VEADEQEGSSRPAAEVQPPISQIYREFRARVSKFAREGAILLEDVFDIAHLQAKRTPQIAEASSGSE